MMELTWLLPLALALTFLLTGAFVRYANSKNLLDTPDHRTSHETPTPRGGGAAIAIVYILVVIILAALSAIPVSYALGIGLGCGAVAAIGFVDDHRDLPAGQRLFAHFLAAIVILFAAGGLPELSLLEQTKILSAISYSVLVLFLVWMLNLYNFMDGINGIASIEGITVSLGAACLAWLEGWEEGIALNLSLTAVLLGFVFWNFPKAKIFMGDVGSGFLGILVGALVLYAGQASESLFWAGLILLGVFLTDATVTLGRRALQGERIHEAHNNHAYQYAARLWNSHTRVTILVAVINLFWLFPIALALVLGWLSAPMALVLAYAPLMILAWAGKSGDRHRQTHSEMGESS